MMKIQTMLIGAALLVSQQLAFAETVKLCGVAWPPFTYAKNKKISSGISYDIFSEAFKRLGKNWRADELPWTRCEKLVKSGQYDAMIDNAPLPDFIFGQTPTSAYPLAIYVRDDALETAFSWDSMQGKKVGMVLGYDYTPKIKSFQGWQPDYTNSDKKVLKKLHAKRYNHAVVDIFSAPILAEELGIKIKALQPLADTTNLFMVFNPQRQSLMQAYEQTIAKMREDGTLDAVYKHHTPYGYNDVVQSVP